MAPFISSGYVYSLSKFENPNNINLKFNSTRAFDIIQRQVDLGPRYPGSEGIEKTRRLIIAELLPGRDWSILFQNFSKKWLDNQNVDLVNIICQPKDHDPTQPSFLLMSHYDTRLWANKDPDPTKHKEPVLGANDGASGVATVLELGRVLKEDYNATNFQLVFFDGEDQGGISGWNFLVGSRFYVESQEFKNENLSFAVLFDMVAGTNAIFERERHSDQCAGKLVTQIWNEADLLGFSNFFVNQSGSHVLDDHVPIIEKGIPAIDIIDDFGQRYKPWHTTFDNMTFIDIKTLEAVGYTLESVLGPLAISTEWKLSFSTFNFRTTIIISDLMGVYLLLVLKKTYHKNKNSKNCKSETISSNTSSTSSLGLPSSNITIISVPYFWKR